jgi:hypothetical protein
LPPAPLDPALEAAASARSAAEQARLGRLRRLGRRVVVGLVACSKSKRQGVHPARGLYTGAFFREALLISEDVHDETWILSARHGLVALDRELVAYDEELPGRRRDRVVWEIDVLSSVANAYLDLPLHLVFLAGAPYVEGVTGIDQRSERWASFNALAIERSGWTYETPLRGLDRRDRWRWFRASSPVAGGRP